MKLYFAGAIRGGRQDASTYHAMIAHLQTHGEVLTEHVGSKALSDGGEQDLTDKEIHARDISWLEECDAVVAEVTTPSLGVGYELGSRKNWASRSFASSTPAIATSASPPCSRATQG